MVIPQAIRAEIGRRLAEVQRDEGVLQKKKLASEMDVAAPLPRLNKYIESELDRLETFTHEGTGGTQHMEAVSALFRSLVREAWEPNTALQPTASCHRG